MILFQVDARASRVNDHVESFQDVTAHNAHCLLPNGAFENLGGRVSEPEATDFQDW